jgi:mutator protein MutT
MKKKVSTVVVVDGKKFLILRRGPESPGSGLWNFPGGSVEPNETTKVAAARELKEEADLDVDSESLKYLNNIQTKYLDITFYITDKFSGDVKINKESDDFKWITLGQVDEYEFVSGGSLNPKIIFEIGKFIYGV